MFICPVCSQEMKSHNEQLIKHNNIYEKECYGSFMFVGDCKIVESNTTIMLNHLKAVFKKVIPPRWR